MSYIIRYIVKVVIGVKNISGTHFDISNNTFGLTTFTPSITLTPHNFSSNYSDFFNNQQKIRIPPGTSPPLEGLGEAPPHGLVSHHIPLFPLTSPPSEGLGEAPLWAWGGFTSLPFPLEWQSNSKVEGLRITEPSDVIEATSAR